MRRCDCTCGGIIDAPDEPTDEELIEAIRNHQKTARHLNWRARGGFDAKPVEWDAYERRPMARIN